jgi:phage terminase large subunit GpA-like protein
MGATPGFLHFLAALAPALRPRRRLSVSEWADAYRVLTSKGSSEPGAWRTARTPYLREIMDALSERSPVREVVLMFATQRGKTEVGLNWIGYVMQHTPAPMLTVLPTLEVRKRWVRQRLDPMLAETPVLASLRSALSKRDAGNAEDIKDFPGGMLVIGGANSPASLASMPIRFVLCDEVDRFPWDVGGEGDPLGLIAERQQNFPRRKTLLVSSPTIKGASQIETAFEATDRRYYHVPCPHCREYQTLTWKQLQWDRALTEARYVCPGCGGEMLEHHKPAMLAAGRWVASNPEAPAWRRGYHLNKLYSPIGLGSTWIELARERVAVQGDVVRLKRFINTSLAESWEDQSGKVEPHVLAARAEPYRLREVPPGCLALTAGVDTQDDRLAVQILGWGWNKRWVIDWTTIFGDTARDEVWEQLAAYLQLPIVNGAGRTLRLAAVAIDAGGHRTQMVHAFTHQHRARLWLAVHGDRYYGRAILAKAPSKLEASASGKTIRHGVEVWPVGTDVAKHEIHGWLTSDATVEAQRRWLHFSEALPNDYYLELTAEVYDPETNRWRKRKGGRRNEGLDTLVYAIAAGHHPRLRLHKKTKAQWGADALLLESALPGTQPAAAARPLEEVRTEIPQPVTAPPIAGRIGSSEWAKRL